MVTIRSVSEADLDVAHHLHNRFTGREKPLETIRSWYEDTPELFGIAYEDENPVGSCTGKKRTATDAELAGLGVEPDFRRRGIGSRLVEQFEDNAAAIGIERIDVAAAGGCVDQFYAENGYVATSILVRSSPDELPEDYRERGYDILEERTDGETRKLYIDVDARDQSYLEAVRETFADDEAIYIMEKTLEQQ